ncbi:MAG TPA: hypothetical protein VKH37_08520, partial [Ferruginibacter sp.]|nr:hypothetical protein [Ferruginibacter sp.]
QDKGAYGRVVHLQPMKWINDWPVIGADDDNDGKGEPVLWYKKPDVGKTFPLSSPVESDEFNTTKLGLQWQWQANPKQTWAFLTGNALRLYAQQMPDSARNLWDIPNVLMQKFPAEEFTVTVKCNCKLHWGEEKFNFIVMGSDYASFSIASKDFGTPYLFFEYCLGADKGNTGTVANATRLTHTELYLRIRVNNGAICSFSYGYDDREYKELYASFTAKPGKWIGSKFGFCCTRVGKTNDAGFVDIDWVRIEN